MGTAIEKGLAEAGYRMLGLENRREQLILSILDSENIRYLKAIPFLIYSYPVDLNRIYFRTSKKKLFAQIIGITRRIFYEEGISKELPDIDEPGNLDYEEFRQEFGMQKLSSEKPDLLIERQKAHAERDLQAQLSQLFTKKEKQTMRRILEDKPVSKTDYEYYSRKTKKKLHSIISLQDFAMALYSNSPRYDEGLFRLKKLLEEELQKGHDRKIPIQRFFVSENKVAVFFKEGKQEKSGEQFSGIKMKALDIGAIKSREILNLLGRYRNAEQDFT